MVYQESFHEDSDMAKRGICITCLRPQEVPGVVKKRKLVNTVTSRASNSENDEVQVLFQKKTTEVCWDAERWIQKSANSCGKMDVSESRSKEIEIIYMQLYNKIGIKKCTSRPKDVKFCVDDVEYVGSFGKKLCDSQSVRGIKSMPSVAYRERRYKKQRIETSVKDANNRIIAIDMSNEDGVRRESAPPRGCCSIISIDVSDDEDVSRETPPSQSGSKTKFHKTEISNKRELIPNCMNRKLKNRVDKNNNPFLNSAVCDVGDITMRDKERVFMSNADETSTNGQFTATNTSSVCLSNVKETEDIILDRVIYLPMVCVINEASGDFTGAFAQRQVPVSSSLSLVQVSKDRLHISGVDKVCEQFGSCRHGFCRQAEEDMKKSVAKRVCVPMLDCIAQKSKFLINLELKLSYSNNVLAPKLIVPKQCSSTSPWPLRRTRAEQVAANLIKK